MAGGGELRPPGTKVLHVCINGAPSAVGGVRVDGELASFFFHSEERGED